MNLKKPAFSKKAYLSKTSSVSLNISDNYHSVTRIVLFNICDFMKGNAMIRHVFIVLILAVLASSITQLGASWPPRDGADLRIFIYSFLILLSFIYIYYAEKIMTGY